MSDDMEFTYSCMPRPELHMEEFSVRAVQPSHIESIRGWRNAQMDVLRQSAPISPAQQRDYYAANVWPAMAMPEPSNILLIFERRGAPIGYGGLVHVAWAHRRAEISFLLDPALVNAPDEYARCFGAFLSLMKELAFEDLDFERLFTETYATRQHHISILEANGFRFEGTLKHHVILDGRPVDSLMHGCLRTFER